MAVVQSHISSMSSDVCSMLIKNLLFYCEFFLKKLSCYRCNCQYVSVGVSSMFFFP